MAFLIRRSPARKAPKRVRLTRLEQVAPYDRISEARRVILQLQREMDEITEEEMQGWSPKMRDLILRQISGHFQLMRAYRDMYDHIHDSAEKLNEYVNERDIRAHEEEFGDVE